MNGADLHLHTFFSDGTFSPEEVVVEAQKHDLACLALTDHDSVEGCARAAAACAAAGIEFIPGAELTAEHEDTEVHLLGYFLDTSHPGLLAALGRFQAVRKQRIYDMVARINELGVPLNVDLVFALANCQSPGRPHVARTLVRERLVRNLDEAFERFLKKGRPAWVPKSKMSAREGVDLIHQAGGLAVLAHPGLNRTDAIIPALVDTGLDGIECYHSKHSNTLAARYREIARQFGLLVTGGSDCHGFSKVRPLIGTVRLADDCVDLLRAKARARQAAPPRNPGTAAA